MSGAAKLNGLYCIEESTPVVKMTRERRQLIKSTKKQGPMPIMTLILITAITAFAFVLGLSLAIKWL